MEVGVGLKAEKSPGLAWGCGEDKACALGWILGREIRLWWEAAGDLGLIPGWEDPLEKDMATHSSILTWEIPWTKVPGRLQSRGSQRVGHN